MKKNTEYRCIKTYKGKFGTYYEGKSYSKVQKLDSYIVYVHYNEEDMIDYASKSKNKLFDIMPGMKFARDKKYALKNNHLFFGDYFSDIKEIRKKKLEKLKLTLFILLFCVSNCITFNI